ASLRTTAPSCFPSRMPGDESPDARRAVAEVKCVAARLQPLIGRGEAVEAAQVVRPGVAGEVLDETPRLLHVLEHAPRHRAVAQARAARLGHERLEFVRAR